MSTVNRQALAAEGLSQAAHNPEVQARPSHLVDTASDFYYHGSVEFLKGQATVVVGDCACSTCGQLDLMDPERRLALIIDDDGYPQLAFHARRSSILTPEEFWDRCTPAHMKTTADAPPPAVPRAARL